MNSPDKKPTYLGIRIQNGSVEFFLATEVIDQAKPKIPTCEIAAGQDFCLTKFHPTQIVSIFGNFSHFYLGTGDRCWLLNDTGIQMFRNAANVH
jgi:hypothetical protein